MARIRNPAVRAREKHRARFKHRWQRLLVPAKLCPDCGTDITFVPTSAVRCRRCAPAHRKRWELQRHQRIYARPDVRLRIATRQRQRRQSEVVRQRESAYMRRPETRERVRRQCRDRYKHDAVFRARVSLDYQKRRATMRGVESRPFPDSWVVDQLAAQGHLCTVCKRRFDDALRFTIDHVIPLVRGGEHAPDNCQLLCQSCNSRKGARI